MLDIARKNGAITIQSTAEQFLANQPEHPLQKVLMISCVHHFPNQDSVLANLSKHMPDGGTCLMFSCSTISAPLFKAFKDLLSSFGVKWGELSEVMESNGLKCKMVTGSEPVQCDKALWYECIRNRFLSTMRELSDAELDAGIEELEEEWKDQDVLRFVVTFKGVVATKPHK